MPDQEMRLTFGRLPTLANVDFRSAEYAPEARIDSTALSTCCIDSEASTSRRMATLSAATEACASTSDPLKPFLNSLDSSASANLFKRSYSAATQYSSKTNGARMSLMSRMQASTAIVERPFAVPRPSRTRVEPSFRAQTWRSSRSEPEFISVD